MSKDLAISKIELVANELLRLRDEAIKARSLDGCEKRMRIDEETFDECIEETGTPARHTAVDYASGKVVTQSEPKKGSAVIVNVVRGRTEISAGRFAASALPTDDRNWSLENTPDPDLEDAMYDDRPAAEAVQGAEGMLTPDNQPARVSDIARHQKTEAEKKMLAMQSRIDDQLAEANFNTECLKAIFNAAKLGTGIIKGPVVIKATKSKWSRTADNTGSTWEQKTVEELKPVAKSVSPWNVFPSPGAGDDQEKLSYIWESGEMAPRELRSLITAPGYIPENIKKVLDSPPHRTRVTVSEGQRVVERTKAILGGTYETWEYHGDVTKEALEVLGHEVGDDFQPQTACVLFVNDIPIKAALYPADNMGLIYHFWQWSKVSGSLFGQGIPRAGRWVQLVITSAWRAMMDNARNTAGGHLVVSGESIRPIEEMGGITVWQADRDVDVRSVMAFHGLHSNQNSYQQIIELALRFFDLETTTPTAFQGDKVTMPETLGATNILVDAGNVAIENRVTWWDKQITEPLLRKFYDYNMMDPDCPDSAKGEYHVLAKGAKSLSNKELQAKMVQEVLMLKQDPDFKYRYDWKKAVDQILRARKLDIERPESEVRADEEKAAQQQGPSDPRLEAAKIKTQGDMQIAQLNQQADMAEIKAKSEEAERQREHERWEKQIEWQMKQAELMAAQQKTLDEIKAKLSVDAEKINLQRELSGPGSGGEALMPPVEPGPRAPVGESYQK